MKSANERRLTTSESSSGRLRAVGPGSVVGMGGGAPVGAVPEILKKPKPPVGLKASFSDVWPIVTERPSAGTRTRKDTRAAGGSR